MKAWDVFAPVVMVSAFAAGVAAAQITATPQQREALVARQWELIGLNTELMTEIENLKRHIEKLQKGTNCV
jgi:hypothetical protein